MSHYSKIFNKVPVQIPNKSGFDLSHENLYTGKCGTLYPVLVDLLLPNDTVSLGHLTQVQLPPMASDFYGRVVAKFEAFFVPNRILFGGWQDFITHPVQGANYPDGTSSFRMVTELPSIVVRANASTSAIPVSFLAPGSLADFLGVKMNAGIPSSANSFTIPNALPFFAYHKIYDDWYRDSRIQAPVFVNDRSETSGVNVAGSGIYSFSPIVYNSQSKATLSDGVSLLSLRQRNWEKDYFTNATPKPQAGDPAQLAFKVDTSTGDGSFTIASLRAANSLQQWMERNNIAGYRYGDQIKAQFGIYPADAITDRAIYLGSHTVDVYNRSVYQQTGSSSSTNNPFDSVGNKFGSSQAVGDGSLIGKFTASEHGFLVVMMSLVPRAYYGSGTRRYLRYNNSADFPFPLLAGVGDQPVYVQELADDVVSDNDKVFGYTQRYSECKYMDDEVHGLLRDGESLSSFALQRTFDADVELGKDFLQIPTDYLDQVAAVADKTVGSYGFWADSYFAYKKVSTLPAYSIPTLGDPKDTHTEIIDNGGKRL